MVLLPGRSLFLCILLLAISTECNRKHRKTKDIHMQPPQYQLHGSNYLPNDKQITTFLRKDEQKQYFYWSPVNNSSLSITTITCSSPIEWLLSYKEANASNTEKILLSTITKEGMKTHTLQPKVGLYVLKLSASEGSTQVHVYVSTEPGGAQALQKSQHQTIKLLNRQRKKRLTVRWSPSLVDPQGTDYCIVISVKRHYTSLCSAQAHSFSVFPNWERRYTKVDPMIVCVGPKTHYTLTGLKQGQTYYFNVYAINRQSNLTYPYGSAHTIFSSKLKPISLKDGKPAFTNLKKYDGKAVFRYKVPRKTFNSSLEFYIMPCGGAVDAEVALNKEIIDSQRGIIGYGRVVIPNPSITSRYYIRILSANREELGKTSGVEIYASTRASSDLPLPKVPQDRHVQEYLSLRTCDSVTIGWVPSPVPKTAHYCIVVKEGKITDVEGFRWPNQCTLESRLKKSADFYVKYCLDVSHGKQPVLTRKINSLRPGKHYIIQVTVKKPRGKTLSYDLLQVQTKPKCDDWPIN